MTDQEIFELLQKNAGPGIKPGLSRTKDLLHQLGDPHLSGKYIHITGTNGKVSTAAIAGEVLGQAGFKVGMYTTPHLWTFHEQFQVNGKAIPDVTFVRLAQQVLDIAMTMEDRPSEFEMMTAIGFAYFQEQHCDLVILEVGLGGKQDSTNVIAAPEVAVITNIGLEHTRMLGNTRAEIAGEKSGIIKHGCDALLYHQSEEVETVVKEVCHAENVALTLTDPNSLEIISSDRDGQYFRYRGKGPYYLRLLGEFQLRNAMTAIDVIDLMRKRGWNITDCALIEGMGNAKWPARMELARRNPDVILDGGHNPQCMEALAESLSKLYPGEKLWFLTGVLADKNYDAMYHSLMPIAKGFVTLTPGNPRALSAADLASYLRSQGQNAEACGSAKEGLDKIFALASPEDRICVCGSLYMIGEIRHLLGFC